MKEIYIDKNNIYIATFLFLLIMSIFANIFTSKVVMNVKLWYKIDNIKLNKNKKIAIFVLSILFILTVIFVLFNIKTSLVLSKNNYNIIREIDIIDKDELQKIDLVVENLEENCKFDILVYEKNMNNVETLVAQFNDFGSDNGIYSISLRCSENSEKYIFKISCIEGRIKVKKINVNNRKVTLNYLFLPTDIILRFKDSSINSVSNSVRIEYIKDAFKILKTSPIIGRGGEAFRYLYKTVNNGNYTSTEVHSSFIQILIESGIIGFSFILLFLIYILKNSKYGTNKIIYILFIIHSCFDLNFSYTICTMYFGILSALCLKNKKNKKNK